MNMFVIQRFKQLRVLTPYYTNQMDEFAKDMSNALEDSSERRVHESKLKKSKSWKCYSKTKCGRMLSSNTLKCSEKTEDSESSLDNWIPSQMEFSTNGSYQHTDSDDIIGKRSNFNYNITNWRHCPMNMGESDSINESFYPLREPKRKRKFKRMSVDPPSVTEHEFPVIPSISSFSKKNRRLRNLKSQKFSKLSGKSAKHSKLTTVSQLSSKMESICKEFGNPATSSGKRKRCVHERSVECSGCDCKDFLCAKSCSNTYQHANPYHHLDCLNSKLREVTSSGLSSSGSECGILTNDESREADDEQSDFFQESGPTCGIPSVSSWWEDNSLLSNKKEVCDSTLQDMPVKFDDMSETTKRLYSIQVENYKSGRQIRAGCRRLGKEIGQVASNSDELLPFMSFTDKYSCLSVSGDNSSAKTSPNEKKKRKGMTESCGPVYDVKQ